MPRPRWESPRDSQRSGTALALRLDTGRVHRAWIVRKPSLRGDIHSLELVDEAGALMCQVFGARSPGAPQRPDWRVLVEEIAGEFGA